jgi:hypothetical protein
VLFGDPFAGVSLGDTAGLYPTFDGRAAGSGAERSKVEGDVQDDLDIAFGAAIPTGLAHVLVVGVDIVDDRLAELLHLDVPAAVDVADTLLVVTLGAEDGHARLLLPTYDSAGSRDARA